MTLYVVVICFCLCCEVLFHCKNRVCSHVLLAKEKEKKKKKSDGIKSFYMQNDLGKGDVSSAHSIFVASSREVGVVARMNSRVSDWWDEPEGC